MHSNKQDNWKGGAGEGGAAKEYPGAIHCSKKGGYDTGHESERVAVKQSDSLYALREEGVSMSSFLYFRRWTMISGQQYDDRVAIERAQMQGWELEEIQRNVERYTLRV